jgi:hypothetical protein
MKSTIQRMLFAVTVAALGAGAGTAGAQTNAASSAPGTSSPHHGHHGHFRRFGGSPLVSPLLRATKQLGQTPGTQGLALTQGQQASIKTILTSARPHRQPGTGPQGPGITVLGDPGNGGYLAAVTAAEAAASARIQRQYDLAEQIWGVLNKDQRNAIPTVLASIQAQQQARRAQWAGRHATGNG